MKITADIHNHTYFSSCAAKESTLMAHVEMAKADGLSFLGLSDHIWDSKVFGASKWYSPQDVEHLLALKEQLPADRIIDGVRILFGCESEFTHNRVLCLSEENAKHFDYFIVPHSHTHMNVVVPRERVATLELHASYLMESFMNLLEHPMISRATAIAHPFVPGTAFDIYNETQALIPDDYFYKAFTAAREKGIAIELNGSCLHDKSAEGLRRCEYARIFTIAKECGCRFTYGSDCHNATKEIREISRVEKFFDICGITEEDMLSLEEILKKNNP